MLLIKKSSNAVLTKSLGARKQHSQLSSKRNEAQVRSGVEPTVKTEYEEI